MFQLFVRYAIPAFGNEYYWSTFNFLKTIKVGLAYLNVVFDSNY